MSILVSLLQPLNAESTILVSLVKVIDFNDAGTEELLKYQTRGRPYKDGIVRLARAEQSKNAYWPIFVTLSGITMLVRPLQPRSAYCPILVTPAGMSMLVRPLQPENA